MLAEVFFLQPFGAFVVRDHVNFESLKRVNRGQPDARHRSLGFVQWSVWQRNGLLESRIDYFRFEL